MECEVCGRKIWGKPVSTVIEGTEMKTCPRCARFGRETKTWSRVPKREPAGRVARPRKKRPYTRPLPEIDVVADYSSIIRRAREAKKLTQEELGRKISEKVSVIARLEAGKMKPSVEMARKLERVLDIKILEELPEEEDFSAPGGAGGELTIGDIIKIKKKGA
ncbi:multiprotein bridging factor aMBF1 [Candidatus Pyrohabitans sp.]